MTDREFRPSKCKMRIQAAAKRNVDQKINSEQAEARRNNSEQFEDRSENITENPRQRNERIVNRRSVDFDER